MVKLELRELTFSYAPDRPPLFKKLDFCVEPQTCSLLATPLGSGKSTFFKLLCGLYPQFGGQITNGGVFLEDQPLEQIVPFERAKRIGMLFQDPDKRFCMATLDQQLTFVLENLQLPADQITAKKQHILQELELTSLKDRQLSTLSGGQKQQAALACVLATESEIILLDEPFANVDPTSKNKLLKLLLKLKKQGKTFIIADHDPSGYQDLLDFAYRFNADHSRLIKFNLSRSTLTSPVPLRWQPLKPGKLTWKQLSLTRGNKLLLKPHDLTLPKGQLGLLSGANGVGKSSLFQALCTLILYQGNLSYAGQRPSRFFKQRWAKKVGLMLQEASAQFSCATVQEELALVSQNTLAPHYWTKERFFYAKQALGLTELAHHSVYQLSGGQQQKLQFLSVLAMGQPVLLLDEPFANLDQASIQTCLTLLKDSCHAEQTTVLLTSHQRVGITEHLDYELILEEQTLKLGGYQT
ncbi:ATP-binding cassette domain-containing protein [Ligilactobacillus murinus]|uniref:ATP-binding cassette domain-containing protein n=1 Tax=Ligilactobacillus murinus TaxID=1622 RepID=UPI0010941EF0|nr:ABC transporter ATP-binding protein [Ligilactobacillus murinus]TGY51449.1 ABC transporter ATP-binding protein [Ligilactobacillus murinus]